MSVAVIYSLYILTAGIVSFLFGGFDRNIILGLGVGFLVFWGNYQLLNLVIRKFLGRNHFLTVQTLFLRFILYAAVAYLCFRGGDVALLMFAVSAIGLSLTIFIVYGIGGVKNQ